MITQLTIKNYALIEDIKVNFEEGLTIITGETGAGKSILLGAMALLLGKRADLSSVKDTTKKCVIEAEFAIDSYQLQDLFKAEDLDYEKHTIIRREILPSGKSRAFVNDSPVNLSALTILGERLIDIHNQHQTQEVSSEEFQFAILDALANTSHLLLSFTTNYKKYQNLQKEIAKLLDNKEKAQKELDYNMFLLQELKEANLKPDEQEALEEEFETLNNVESIQETLSEITQMLDADQIGVLHVLKESNQKLNKLKEVSSTFQSFWERVQSVQIELDDIYAEITKMAETLEANPTRLQEIENRLQLIYKLQKKHQCTSIQELVALQNELETKVEKTTNLELQITQLENEKILLKAEIEAIGTAIHNKRMEVIPTLIDELENILFQLGLPNARFKIELQKTEEFSSNGMDALQFLFTANKGTNFGELKKVASGGEMSRIMLAVKSILANYSHLPTIIFDEIDTGVSGEIANKIAQIMKKMSTKMQVLSITHLPQIAAKGKHHFKVYKLDIEEVTYTKLKLLTQEERVQELAQMLGGKKKSASAIAHAKELLN
ncbi:MAG: DNA repair protein RecN [Flavobacteriaceae bacterium CG2_30_34_30]|nr:DNA repair protein RecN [Flavobacteriia bacterium]OIP51704.1 MAG: DNA repair protein RecN [Flavobacteriaceae bacterium CG2_30_34_30]PIQ17097.1 MAG: DNA repair protein RecN [Flavobacteriaceae bacterium CG18_big_fil_WC_8_21_14_2_50_34_36]PIV49726.1 MAG: DNA repair protein RecN [Flavobacteriaceae bacterium CG02_land_8_20_14_3_00_34_13]PIZ09175.1 MAG: DNA repair protein RecN [Flavobacteriaceae bacterium CG_4_10_14_0_8_um_filter_34_31]PJC06571.1 MAG: DNA repair protein RecN [Flavobacteriaceae ba